MAKGRPKEPLVWGLFSGGGMAAAMLLPAVAAVLWVAVPLGWLPPLDPERAATVTAHPLARLALGALFVLFFFHWAHRFRYTLYDGLQLYHLNRFIALVTYGVALLLSVGAAWVLWTLG